MPFKTTFLSPLWHSYPVKVGFLAVAWLILITYLHFSLNADHEKRQVVKMGYMPVITNLAAPLLDAASAEDDAGVCFKAIKFASFAEMAEALRNDEIQAAFIIAPLSIVLRQQGEDVRVVYIGNRHESTFVVRKGLHAHSISDLVGRTIAVPMRFSGHNVALLNLIAEAGLTDQIHIVEMNPPDMASAMTAGALDGYFVGEPFAAQTLKEGQSELFLHIEQIWPDFICNLLLVKQSLIDQNPETVQLLVGGAARSGIWASRNLTQAAQIASKYWGQPEELVDFALNTPKQRIVFDQFVPLSREMQQLADLMVRFGLIKDDKIEGLVEDRFARGVNLTAVNQLNSILQIQPSVGLLKP